MTYEMAVYQNARVWARRMNLEVDKETLIPALKKAGFEGSVLKGPLSLLFFKKIGQEEWCVGLENETKKKLAMIASFTVTDVVRNESVNLLKTMAKHADTVEGGVAFSQYSPHLLDLVSYALLTRAKEKAQPNIVSAITDKLHRR